MANFFEKVFCDPSNYDILENMTSYLSAEEYFDLCEAYEGCLYRDIATAKLDKYDNDQIYLKFFCNYYENKKFHNYLKSIICSEFSVLQTVKSEHFEHFNRSDVEDFFAIRLEEADDEYMFDETDPDLIFYQGLKREIKKNPGSWWEFVDFAHTRYFLYDIVFWYDFVNPAIFNDIFYNCCWSYFASEEGEFLFNENFEADRNMEQLFFEIFHSTVNPRRDIADPYFSLEDFEKIFYDVYSKYFDELDDVPDRIDSPEYRHYQEDEYSDQGFFDMSSEEDDENMEIDE